MAKVGFWLKGANGKLAGAPPKSHRNARKNKKFFVFIFVFVIFYLLLHTEVCAKLLTLGHSNKLDDSRLIATLHTEVCAKLLTERHPALPSQISITDKLLTK